MSIPEYPYPAQAVLSILSSQWSLFWPDLLKDLKKELGDTDYISDILAFTETDYYNQELGTPIQRRILGFGPLVDQEDLVKIKLWTNSLEQEHKRPDGTRLFNLDPGLITLERLVLATGKNYTHRIYLREGIWADLTLIYRARGWQSLPWTYPDYASRYIQEILTNLRNIYKTKLKAYKKGNR